MSRRLPALLATGPRALSIGVSAQDHEWNDPGPIGFEADLCSGQAALALTSITEPPPKR